MFFKRNWSLVDWWIGMSNRLSGSSTWSLGSLKCDSWATCARQIELSRGVVQRTEPLLGSWGWWALGLGSPTSLWLVNSQARGLSWARPLSTSRAHEFALGRAEHTAWRATSQSQIVTKWQPFFWRSYSLVNF